MGNESNENFKELQEKINREYGEIVPDFGIEKSKDFFSEMTRKRQSNLLVFSMISILVSYSIIEIKELSSNGLSTTFNSINSNATLPILAGIVVLYFLAVFLLSLKQDYESHKYSLMRLFTVNKELQSNLRRQIDFQDEQSRILDQKLDTNLKRQEELRSEENPYQAQVDELSSKREELEKEFDLYMNHEDKYRILEFYPEGHKRSQKISREEEKLRKKVYAWKDQHDAEFTRLANEFSTIFKDISKYNSLSNQIKLMHLQTITLPRGWFVDLRLLLEVIFPILISLYAAAISFRGTSVFLDLYNQIGSLFR